MHPTLQHGSFLAALLSVLLTCSSFRTVVSFTPSFSSMASVQCARSTPNPQSAVGPLRKSVSNVIEDEVMLTENEKLTSAYGNDQSKSFDDLNDDDWSNYDYSSYDYSSYNKTPSHVRKFQEQGIVYKKGILSREEFQDILEEIDTHSLNLVKETTSSVARNRVGAQLPPTSRVVDILSNPDGSLVKLMNELHDDAGSIPQTGTGESSTEESNNGKKKMVLSRIIPVELRIYEERGAGMEWHVDDILFTPEQTEVVFTLENNSDCLTMWEEKQKKQNDGNTQSGDDGNDDDRDELFDYQLKHVETEANSAIILKAGPKEGARHSVSSLKSGKRAILKFVFVREDAVFLEGAEVHANQFMSKKAKGKKKKKRSKK